MRLALVAMWITLVGCGGSFTLNARRALATSAEVLVSTDRYSATLYSNAADQAVQVSTDILDYRRRMEEYDELETTLRAAHIALLAAEAGLDVYEESGRKGDFLQGVACVVDIFSDLADRIGDITGERYQAIQTAADALRSYGGECNRERLSN